MARWLAILIIILSLAAAALCLWVSEISYCSSVDCTAPDKLDFSNEINRLATLVDWRTAYYQLAWWFSMITIPLFFILFWGSLNWTNRPGPQTHERPDKTH
jgi:hypothetical protein